MLSRDKLNLITLHKRITADRLGNDPRSAEHTSAKVSNLLMSTEEEEKKRIVRELHDGLGQLLTSINLHAQRCLTATDSLVEHPQAINESLQLISSMTKQAMGEVRGICGALRPAILDDLGVVAAIKWQCRQITQGYPGLTARAEFDVVEEHIPADYKTSIYRIVQEAMNNAVKYAQAKTISIMLCRTGDDLQLNIQDNGVGFDPVSVVDMGMGLMSMRERAETLGGVFKLQSSSGQGVSISVLLPLEKVALNG